MSLKAELETWAAALKAYDEENFTLSLELFSVRYNTGLIVCCFLTPHRILHSALQIHPRY